MSEPRIRVRQASYGGYIVERYNGLSGMAIQSDPDRELALRKGRAAAHRDDVPFEDLTEGAEILKFGGAKWAR
jgi:hypothetical protein|tara:strand:- start:24915 stop:25133 length:219 start_codon:yes stop_codon:yes gene_type:complete